MGAAILASTLPVSVPTSRLFRRRKSQATNEGTEGSNPSPSGYEALKKQLEDKCEIAANRRIEAARRSYPGDGRERGRP